MRKSMRDKQLSKILNCISDDKRYLANDMLQEIFFLRKTMATLKEDIDANGATDTFTQGQNIIQRPSASFQAYIAATGKYTALIGKLVQLLPKEEVKKAGGVETWLQQYENESVGVQ